MPAKKTDKNDAKTDETTDAGQGSATPDGAVDPPDATEVEAGEVTAPKNNEGAFDVLGADKRRVLHAVSYDLALSEARRIAALTGEDLKVVSSKD